MKMHKCERRVKWGRWQRWGTEVKLGPAKMATGLGEECQKGNKKRTGIYLLKNTEKDIEGESDFVLLLIYIYAKGSHHD